MATMSMIEPKWTSGAATVAAIRLAYGSAPEADVDWQDVMAAAIAERCAPLAWLRSSETIRQLAPDPVAAQWRRHMLCAAEGSTIQARELLALCRLLTDQGIRVVVLKGIPLSVVLYGDAAARPTTDFDLFVRREDRSLAHRAIIDAGWDHLRGAAPAESLYQRRTPAVCPWLEVHSSLLDENLLAHLAVPSPDAQRVDLVEGTVDAHCGLTLPVFLAAHLAKHTDPPLLWWIDFATAYGGLDASGRQAVTRHAKELRLDRYLDWAIRGAGMLTNVATGPMEDASGWLAALQAYGHRHNAGRIVMLAATGRDRLTIMFAWIWPREMRWNAGMFAHQAWHRLTRLRRSLERQWRGAPRAARSG